MHKNFKLIKSNIDVSVFMNEINNFLKSNNNWSTKRAERISFHEKTKHIAIRHCVLVNKKGLTQEEELYAASDSEDNELNIINYPYFTKTYSFLEDFATSINGQIMRAVIVTLEPNSQVYPHIDGGKFPLNKDRYHIPVKTGGSLNICDDEEQIYREGELWWFNNKKMHSAFNTSNEERIHIIFDILPKKRNLLRKAKDYFEKKIALGLSELKS